MTQKKLYKCDDCNLHYEDETTAQECYDFCVKNHACSVEITKKSEEHKKLVAEKKSL